MSFGSMKRTSSSVTSSTSTSSAPRSRKNSTRRWTSSSGALAPEVIPTVSTPSSHSSRTSCSLSIRWDAAPCWRATSTSRFELEEFRDPITSTRSQRELLDRVLAVLRRVTDVVGAWPDHVRELLVEAADDARGLVDRERRLGDESDAIRVRHVEPLDVVLGLHEQD